MVTPEFKEAVSLNNLLRVRLMLKDAFLVDPTLDMFEERLNYAKARLPNLLEPHDGELLETDQSQWDRKFLDEELYKLVTNFSEERIDHLRNVTQRVMCGQIEAILAERARQRRTEALRRLWKAANKVPAIQRQVQGNDGKWNRKTIGEMEAAAQEILRAIQEYKAN